LTVCFLWNLRWAFHYVSSDMAVFFLEWYRHILEHGRLASLEGSFVTYTPPYVYLMSLSTLLEGHLSRVVNVKLFSLAFFPIVAWLFWSICRALGCSNRRSLLAAWIAVVSPEVLLNTFCYGQCDILHTCFLLLFARLLLARRPGWAMVALGVALSFKLQTIFAGPLVLALLLTGELPLWTVLLVPLVYCVMMIPAALAGRPWMELLLVYRQQTGLYDDLGRLVANPYMALAGWTVGRSVHTMALLKRAGLIVAALVNVGLVEFLRRSRPLLQGERLIAALGLSLLVEPFVLPMMHDRYFFAGNLTILLLAMVVPRMAVPAVLLQMSAAMAYRAFLLSRFHGTKYWSFAALLVAVSIVLVWRQVRRGTPRPPEPMAGAADLATG
jgi:Gpi18-like mannosyltransferase